MCLSRQKISDFFLEKSILQFVIGLVSFAVVYSPKYTFYSEKKYRKFSKLVIKIRKKWLVSEFTFTENSCSKAIYSILRNYVSLQFYVVNSHLCPICMISGILCEITLKLISFYTEIIKISQIVIHKFHGSHKWWNVK